MLDLRWDDWFKYEVGFISQCMPIEKPSNAEDLPKLLNAELGVEYIMTFPVQDIVKSKLNVKDKHGKDATWSRYALVDMELDIEGQDESQNNPVIGTDDVPFWAMESFYDAVVEFEKRNPRKKIIVLVYTRHSDPKGSRAEFEL